MPKAMADTRGNRFVVNRFAREHPVIQGLLGAVVLTAWGWLVLGWPLLFSAVPSAALGVIVWSGCRPNGWLHDMPLWRRPKSKSS
jgi:hypothetical protein